MKKKRTLLILITVLILSTLACDTGIRNPGLYEIVRRGYLVKGKEDPPPQVIIVPNEDENMPAQPTEIPQDGEPPIVIEIPENPAPVNPPAADEKAPLPDAPVTYTGDMSGMPVSMTVDFQSGEVTGSGSYTDNNSFTTIEIEGAIDTTTLTVTTTYSGTTASTEYGLQAAISGAIFGPVSADYSTFSASWVNESGDSGKFIALR